jgi:hypothetical protein
MIYNRITLFNKWKLILLIKNLIMPILVESNKATATARNTGANGQVLEGPVIKYALATTEQEFATVAAAKALTNWKADVALKKIIPFFELEELAIGDTTH